LTNFLKERKSLGISRRDKKGGVVTSTVVGVGGLIIATIVILIVIQTLNNASLIPDTSSTTTITNETINLGGTGIASISITDAYFSSWNATLVLNNTIGAGQGATNDTLTEGVDYAIGSANATLLQITTTWNSSLVTYDWTKIFTASNDAVDNLTTNFTDGIDEISLQIPTILLIVAVVFLFGALALLIRSSRQMGTEGSGGSSL